MADSRCVQEGSQALVCNERGLGGILEVSGLRDSGGDVEGMQGMISKKSMVRPEVVGVLRVGNYGLQACSFFQSACGLCGFAVTMVRNMVLSRTPVLEWVVHSWHRRSTLV